MAVWILSVSCYIIAVFVTFFIPVPMFGITGDGEVYGLRGQDEWAKFPYKAIAAGVFYFLALGLTRMLGKGASMDLSTMDAPADPTDATAGR